MSKEFPDFSNPKRIRIRFFVSVFVLVVVLLVGLGCFQFVLTRSYPRPTAHPGDFSEVVSKNYLLIQDHAGDASPIQAEIVRLDGNTLKKASHIDAFYPGGDKTLLQSWQGVEFSGNPVLEFFDSSTGAFQALVAPTNKILTQVSYSPDMKYLLAQFGDEAFIQDVQSGNWKNIGEFSQLPVGTSAFEWTQADSHALFVVVLGYAKDGTEEQRARYVIDPTSWKISPYAMDASYGPLKVNKRLVEEYESPLIELKRSLFVGWAKIISKASGEIKLSWFTSRNRIAVNSYTIKGDASHVLLQLDNRMGLLDLESGRYAQLFESPFFHPEIGIPTVDVFSL